MLDDRPGQDHYNYDLLHDCPCRLCSGYRVLEASAKRRRASGGPACDIPFIAQSMRRDTYSELTYVVRDRAWAAEFLAWVLAILDDRGCKDDHWWAIRAQERSLGQWIEDWAVASGRLPA